MRNTNKTLTTEKGAKMHFRGCLGIIDILNNFTLFY